MPLWIFATLFASCVQTLRFMFQRHIKRAGLSTAAATQARFVWGAPIAAFGVLMYIHTTQQNFPVIPVHFWPYALWGGVSQILATMCVVALFSHRHFAIGITLKKTEALMTVFVGFAILGESVSPLGFGAIALGFIGLILLSKPPQGAYVFWSRAMALGLASGLLFAFSSVGYRAATLEIASEDPFLRAGITLTLVASSQALLLGAWMLWAERAQLWGIFHRWPLTALVGLTSALGSFGWFLAFTLQTAAYVKALGQVELIFSCLVSWIVFSERLTKRELVGVALIGSSMVGLVLSV